MPMKTSLDHLPPRKQRELNRVVLTLLREFDDALKMATSKRKQAARILKIILYGSYARGDWVDEERTGRGFQSDYDILIVVNYKELAIEPIYWNAAEDRFLWHGDFRTPVEMIVHTLGEVNKNIREGRYFFKDIVREGIMLYEMQESTRHRLAAPGNLSPAEALEMTAEYFEDGMGYVKNFFRATKNACDDGEHKFGAFQLHQAAENAYHTVMLTHTLYAPKIHNLMKLRNMTRKVVPELNDVWPDDSRLSRRCFQLLKDAYVKARYSRHYRITPEELEWLMERVAHLNRLTETACKKRIAAMKAAMK